MNSGVRVKDSFGNQKFGTKEKLIAAGAILASLATGAVGGYVASNIFSGYSKGKEYAVKYFQGSNSKSIRFCAGYFCVMDEKEDIIQFEQFRLAERLYGESKIENKKFNQNAFKILRDYDFFYSIYTNNLFKKYIEIALKHRFCAFGNSREPEGYKDIFDLTIRVIPENEKLTVRIFQFNNETEIFEDVTEDFIKENGKAFVNDLVEFVNSDDFMKQVLLGVKDEKAEGGNDDENENENENENE